MHPVNGRAKRLAMGVLLAVMCLVALPAAAHAATLTVDPAGGTWMGSTSRQTRSGSPGGVTFLPAPSWVGHTFAGWKASGAGSKGDGSFTFGNGDATLTAAWDASSYSVRYDAAGGTGAPDAESHACGERWAIPTATPTRDGYEFVDWVTAAQAKTYTPGQQVIDCMTLDGSTVTLRAEWKPTQETIDKSRSKASRPRGSVSSDAGSAPADVRAFVEKAMSAIGSGYSGSGYNWTGSTSGSWFTCSGLVDWALGNAPQTSWPESLRDRTGMSKSIDQLAYGDLVYYEYRGRHPGHVGIYIGNGKIVDSEPNGGVQVRDVDFPGTYLGGGSIL